MALTVRSDYRDWIGQIACPTLLIAGNDDRVCPVERHVEIQSRIPHARLKIIDTCGHISTLEQPDQVNDALLALLNAPPARMTQTGNHQLTLLENE
jgi:pimeloyl-ACP methyl ester carboxylesterase